MNMGVHRSSAAGSLVCHLSAGLTNQENMVENCLRIAHLLNRNLVLPSPALTAIQPNIVSRSRANFSDLWNETHFENCARMHFNVTVENPAALQGLASTSAEQPPEDLATLSIHLDRQKGIWRLDPLDSNGYVLEQFTVPWSKKDSHQEALRSLVLRNFSHHKVIRVVSPFCAIACSGQRDQFARECYKPNHAIESVAEQYLRTLPAHFNCVHARVELDWLRVCCHSALTNVSLPASATMSEARGHCEHTHQPPAHNCYVSAHELARFLLRTLPRNSTLFVASGADNDLLAPLASAFDVRRLPRLEPSRSAQAQTSEQEQVWASYTQAMAERHVCAAADRFFGAKGSSFTSSINTLRLARGALYVADLGATKRQEPAPVLHSSDTRAPSRNATIWTNRETKNSGRAPSVEYFNYM
uniref:O-fucosyltransferase family protein n=1 Tax=Chrysotila carterae TaxID=13221 RepID=A0A7S4C252_CHRCT|mmetsp:Transcript_2553/g.5383  ORF Transcript_2553/g.5383 Transcript_2553/m.5383 type:complete len:415 (-) Transcript_2553:221-1465(-)